MQVIPRRASTHALSIHALLLLLVASAAAGDPAGPFSGRVLDRNGAPVPDAEVVLRVRHLNGWDVRRLKTDAQGRFTIADLRRGRVALLARAPDGRVGLASVVNMPESLAGGATVTVTEPRSLRLRTLDPDGHPLPGACVHTIRLTGPDGDFVLWPETVEAFGLVWPRSDRDGLLKVGDLPAAGPMTVSVAHPRFVRGEAKGVLPDATEPVPVRLARGGILSLRLKAVGVALPPRGLKLDLYPRDGEPYFVDEPFAPDENGSRIFIVPPGTYSGIVRGPDVQTLPALFENVTVRPEQPGEITIALTPRGLVRGRVLDAVTGEPVADCVVSAAVHSDKHDTDPYGYGPGWYHSAHAVTDAEGNYEITPGVGLARLRARSRRPAEPPQIEVEVPPDRPVEVPPFRLTPPPRLTGVVLAPDGRPVPHAVLKPTGEQRYQAAAVADAAGRFDFTVEAFDQPDPAEPVGTLSLRIFDPHRPLGTELTTAIDLRRPGEPLTVRLIPSPIPPPPGPTSTEPRYVSVPLGQPAPELAGRESLNSDGPLRLADHRGRFILLDFWTVWCGPCRQQKPEVEAAARLYADRLTVIGVHDNSVPPETIAADVQKNGPAFPTLIDTADDATTRRYGVDAFPTCVLIGPDGRVLLTSGHNAEALWADLLFTLRSFLDGPEHRGPVEAPRP